MEGYRTQDDPANTLVRLIGHGVKALRDGDGDATTTARVTLANLDRLADLHRRAVEDRAVLRQVVEDIANQIADEGMTGWAADIRDELHRLGVGGRSEGSDSSRESQAKESNDG